MNEVSTRRRFQLSIRSAALLTLAVGLALAWYRERQSLLAERQAWAPIRAAAESLRTGKVKPFAGPGIPFRCEIDGFPVSVEVSPDEPFQTSIVCPLMPTTTSNSPVDDSAGSASSQSGIEAQAALRIEGELKEPTRFDFSETSLFDAVDYFKDLHGIEIQIDSGALNELSDEVQVTGRARDIPLEAGLRQLLQPLQLIAYCDGQVLLISTESAAARRISVRVYDCGWARPERLAEIAEFAKLAGIEKAEAAEGGKPPEELNRAAAGPRSFAVVPVGGNLSVRANPLQHATIRRSLDELKRIEWTRTAAQGTSRHGSQ